MENYYLYLVLIIYSLIVAKILVSETPKTNNSGVNSGEDSGLKCRLDLFANTFSARYLDFVFSIVSSFLVNHLGKSKILSLN